MGSPLGWNVTEALCGKCLEWLPHDAFGPRTDPRYLRPVRSHCRRCEAQALSARYLVNKDKWRARSAVSQALARGDMSRQPCAECGKPHAHAHHPDYSKPLDVVWLCPSHHNRLHGRRVEKALAD